MPLCTDKGAKGTGRTTLSLEENSSNIWIRSCSCSLLGGVFCCCFFVFWGFFLLFPLHLFSKHLVFWTTEKKWMWKKLRNLYKTLYFLLDKEKCRSSAQICVYKSKREVLWSKAEGSLRHISCKYRDGLKFLQKKLFCHKGAHSFCFLNEQLFWKWVACVYHCGKAVVKCVDSCCWALIRFFFFWVLYLQYSCFLLLEIYGNQL